MPILADGIYPRVVLLPYGNESSQEIGVSEIVCVYPGNLYRKNVVGIVFLTLRPPHAVCQASRAIWVRMWCEWLDRR